MKKYILLLIALCPLQGYAQKQLDDNLNSLVRSVLELRKTDVKSQRRAQEQLTASFAIWNPMVETGDLKDGECAYGEVEGFQLNRLMHQIASSQKRVITHGDMRVGTDARFDYTLCERSVKAGCTVSFPLKGREGRQCFVIVPYSDKGSFICAALSVDDDEPVAFEPSDNGILIGWIDNPQLTGEQTVTLFIYGKQNQAFAILNHNSRK